jgi:rhodanese-related sulfurtransferase
MPSDTEFDMPTMLAAAAQRAREANAPMAGLLKPEEAWALYREGAIDIVDTRTLAERDLVGYVPGSVPIEWYDYPAKKRNEGFLDALRAKVEPDRPVAFLCRSGVRSHQAAALATANGYAAAFNILDGFEGDKNEHGQRVVSGWRVRGLPWRQD